MKNEFCKLTYDEIKKVPDRYQPFFFSPFHFNVSGDYVLVPTDSFQKMIDILSDDAKKHIAQQTKPDSHKKETLMQIAEDLEKTAEVVKEHGLINSSAEFIKTAQQLRAFV